MRREALFVVALGAGLAGPARAHDTWILPTAFHVPTGGTVELDMTSGMGFPRNDTAVTADRIADSGFRIGTSRGPLTPSRSTDGALRLSGTDYTIVSLKKR